MLKTYFPQAREWAGDLRTAAAGEFLDSWPSLEALQRAPRSRVRRFYQEHRRLSAEELRQLGQAIDQAQPLTRDRALVEASALMAQTLAEPLKAVIAALARLDQELEKLFAQHPDHDLFADLPGAGEALAPRLTVAFGSDRDRYLSAQQLQQFAGLAPVTESSGKSRWTHWRLACPKFLRQTFHEFAAASIPRSLWARAYYQQQRQRGASHHGAVRALAYKWIRILYRCWKDRTPYDEQVYLKALKRRHSSLWLAVVSLSMPEAHPLNYAQKNLDPNNSDVLRLSLTFDNGTEFAAHYLLNQQLGLPTFFCDPHKPWQKGGIENAIGRLRRHLPRKTDLAALPSDDLQACVLRYNNTPRKCLRFLTPLEALAYASPGVALQT